MKELLDVVKSVWLCINQEDAVIVHGAVAVTLRFDFLTSFAGRGTTLYKKHTLGETIEMVKCLCLACSQFLGREQRSVVTTWSNQLTFQAFLDEVGM